MALRVALASSDGINIDLHFAQAHTFYIYDLDETGFALVEKRSAFETKGHNEAEFGRVSLMLKDCAAVFVSRIGPPAAKALLEAGVRVFEAPYPVEAVLEKFRKTQLRIQHFKDDQNE